MWIRCADGTLLNTDKVQRFRCTVDGLGVYAELSEGSMQMVHPGSGSKEDAKARLDRLHRLMHEGALADVTF